MLNGIKIFTFFIIISLMQGCVFPHSNSTFFKDLQVSTDDYGYTAENPVKIKNGPIQNSINSSYYYLSRLRTEDGKSLKILSRISIDIPNSQPNPLLANPIAQVLTGLPAIEYIDVYELKVVGSEKIITLYINAYSSGSVKIPAGLKFEE